MPPSPKLSLPASFPSLLVEASLTVTVLLLEIINLVTLFFWTVPGGLNSLTLKNETGVHTTAVIKDHPFGYSLFGHRCFFEDVNNNVTI